MQLFHYRQNGVDRGPYSLDQMLSMWQRGMIGPEDKIRDHDDTHWQVAKNWIRNADSRQSRPYNLIIEEQAPVDVVTKIKTFPNRGLATVALITAAGLWMIHWGWTLGFGLFALFLIRPKFQCSTCHHEVGGSADWCSHCGSHLES